MKTIKTILLIAAGLLVAVYMFRETILHISPPPQLDLALMAAAVACFTAFCFCQAWRGK